MISSEIIKYVYNSKILNENLTTEEAGLKDNSEIVVYVKNPLNYIYLKFRSINSKNMEKNKTIKIECLKTEAMSSIFLRYSRKLNISNQDIRYYFNSKEIGYYSEENIEKLGIKNESIIIVDYLFRF